MDTITAFYLAYIRFSLKEKFSSYFNDVTYGISEHTTSTLRSQYLL